MKASDNTEKLAKIPGVSDVHRVSLSKVSKEKRIGELWKQTQANNRQIFVYRFMYKSHGANIRGFLIEPRVGKSKLPSIIWNRGGSKNFGALEIRNLFNGFIPYLARNGYVVIASQYSGGPGSDGTDEWGSENNLKEVLDLRKILKAYTRADHECIGVAGGSRGGMMTYLALKKVRWLKAAVSIAGTADLFENAKSRPGMHENIFKPLFGGSKKEMRARSAVCWADTFASKTPLLLMHGTADWRVSPTQSLALAGELQKHRKPYRLIMFEGADHGLTEARDEALPQMLAWLDRYVKRGEPLPDLKPHGR